jgi:hypothetical protein
MASKYLQKFPVPEGFPEILHDFTREILRDQPDDIIAYAAEYFASLNEVSLYISRKQYSRKCYFLLGKTIRVRVEI